MAVWAMAAMFAMAKPVAEVAPREHIRILPVPPTPESNAVQVAIAAPRKGEVIGNNPVWIQFRLDGYPLGAASSFERANEVAVSRLGQTMHVVLDNRPYLAVDEPAIDPFNEQGFYYDTSYKFEVPFSFKEGMHVIRMFPVRSFGESLKGESTFAASVFYLGKKGPDLDVDLAGPYLTYNEPSDQTPLTADKPLLLDFYLTNCELTRDGYKVRLTIDKKVERVLTSWQPYYIYGLQSGKHTIRLQLIDRSGKQVPGLFNDVEQTVQIQ